MTTHQIIVSDSRNLSQIPSASIHLIVTSPPYPMIEMWDALFTAQDPSIGTDLSSGNGEQAFLKMHALLNSVWSECDRVLVENGFLCINIGDATRTLNQNFRMYSNHTQIISFFTRLGYSVLPDILWRKPSNAPNKFMGSGMYPAGAYVTYEHEYILVFRKGGKRIFKGDARSRRQKSAYFWEERNVWFSDLWEINGTSQSISASHGSRSRNASFPFEIPYRLVNMYSVEGDTVLDPFDGMGTTNFACMAANRNSIGSERDPEIAALALNTLSTTPETLNRVISARLTQHRTFISNLSQEEQDRCYPNPYHGFLVKTKQETSIKIDEVASIVREGHTISCQYK